MKAWSWSGASADDVVGILRRESWRENWRVKLGTGFPNDAIIVMVNGLCLPCHDEILMFETIVAGTLV